MADRATVGIALVYPDLLGTYGDGGNATILARRLRWRGIEAEVVAISLGDPVPESCELYLLGGGEDSPQALAAAELRASGALARAADRGAAVLAVCAGVQVVGTRFLTADGLRDGVGLVDVDTGRGLARRAVGELVVEPDPALGIPVLTGYENHAGASTLGPGLAPLGAVRTGVGNGDGGDGFFSGRLFGTYLHGPVLARNPELADRVLTAVLGPLPPADHELEAADAEAADLRAERLAAVRAGVRTSARRRRYPWRRTPRS